MAPPREYDYRRHKLSQSLIAARLFKEAKFLREKIRVALRDP